MTHKCNIIFKEDNKTKSVHSGGLACPYCGCYGFSKIVKKINQQKFKCICWECMKTFTMIMKEPYQLCKCITTNPYTYEHCNYCFNGRVVDFIESIRGVGGSMIILRDEVVSNENKK